MEHHLHQKNLLLSRINNGMTIEHHQRHLSQFLADNKGHLFGSVHSCGRQTFLQQPG